jgi:DNA repair protein RecN (Recombination protein N)
MLQNLHVKNLALIDECEVEFSDGLNILSGETGAGKSIIIGSINLALGEKVQKEMLRDNEKPAFVELIFSVEDPKIIEALRELDVEVEDGCVILSRKITQSRAVGRVNGEAVSVSRMKEIASYLIDIHGQHEHQSLLSKKKHLDILDEYAKQPLGDKKQQLSVTYKAYRALKDEYEKSNIDNEERSRELSFLEYEVKEIEEASLVPGEDEELEAQFRKFSNGKKIMEGVNAAYSATGGEMESASELIGRAVRELSLVSGYDEDVEALESQLSEIDSLLSDFNHEISGYISQAEFDEETFYETQKRLDEINHLKSKYGNSIDDILIALNEKRERISVLNDYDSYLQKLEQQLAKKEKELAQISDEVSEIRQKSAVKLVSEIKSALNDLNFLDVQFDMQFDRLPDYTANGIDAPEFLISTNPGEPLKPLGKVASGGELSVALDEVVISGSNITQKVDRMVVVPTATAMKNSYNPYDLMLNLAIPHFCINCRISGYGWNQHSLAQNLAQILAGRLVVCFLLSFFLPFSFFFLFLLDLLCNRSIDIRISRLARCSLALFYEHDLDCLQTLCGEWHLGNPSRAKQPIKIIQHKHELRFL